MRLIRCFSFGKVSNSRFLASGYTGDYEGKQEYKRSIVVDELD